MKVLVACEFSGVVRDAFRKRGHDAWSCDLQPSMAPGPHLRGDVLEVLGDGWDLMIAHPPCTYLTRAAAWRWKDTAAEIAAAVEFVKVLWAAPIPGVVIENPHGRLNKLWRRPDQVIHPWQFGHEKSKPLCLWIRGLPPLLEQTWCLRREQWVAAACGTRSRANYRSRTFEGIAAAMAEQWGGAELAAGRNTRAAGAGDMGKGGEAMV